MVFAHLLLLAILPQPVLLILGAVIVVLGALRLLGLLPSVGRTWLTFDRRRNPLASGITMILLGAIVLGVAFVR